MTNDDLTPGEERKRGDKLTADCGLTSLAVRRSWNTTGGYSSGETRTESEKRIENLEEEEGGGGPPVPASSLMNYSLWRSVAPNRSSLRSLGTDWEKYSIGCCIGNRWQILIRIIGVLNPSRQCSAGFLVQSNVHSRKMKSVYFTLEIFTTTLWVLDEKSKLLTVFFFFFFFFLILGVSKLLCFIFKFL